MKNSIDHIESNDVELSGRVPQFIQPSKTLKGEAWNDLKRTYTSSKSGEARGAPQGRSAPLPEPREIRPTATMTQNFATLSHLQERPRQVNPDIQDIITGIVKLLNGKVNVQANTAPAHGRPIRPLSSRINNRGPPRITDVPALPPDFDVPAPLPPPPLEMTPPVSPTKMPTPYPFDLPPHNTSPIRPFPMDKIIPLGTTNKRPPIYRPPVPPPWNRPPGRRPIPSRRPIPPHKPLPPRIQEENISITSEKPVEDILEFNIEHELRPSIESESVETEQEEEEEDTSTEVPLNFSMHSNEEKTKETMKEDHNKSEEIEDESTEDHSEVVGTENNTQIKEEIETSRIEINPTTTSTRENLNETSTSSISTEESSTITPTSVKDEIVTTPLLNTTLTAGVEIKATSGDANKTPALESSIQEVMQTLKEELLKPSSAKPTESLPENNLTSTYPPKISETPIKTEAIQSKSKKIYLFMFRFAEKHFLFAETQTSQFTQTYHSYSYRPRPGIVLDDTEYKPVRQSIVTARPQSAHGDIFDVTVSAIQGPGHSGQGKPFVIPGNSFQYIYISFKTNYSLLSFAVDIDSVNLGSNSDVITSPQGDQGFVSIDGRRTYLFGDPTISSQVAVTPSKVSSNSISATGYAVVDVEKKPEGLHNSIKPAKKRPSYAKPSQPPVR